MLVALRRQDRLEDCQPIVRRFVTEVDCLCMLVDEFCQLAKQITRLLKIFKPDGDLGARRTTKNLYISIVLGFLSLLDNFKSLGAY
jgi:hypothetical protein